MDPLIILLPFDIFQNRFMSLVYVFFLSPYSLLHVFHSFWRYYITTDHSISTNLLHLTQINHNFIKKMLPIPYPPLHLPFTITSMQLSPSIPPFPPSKELSNNHDYLFILLSFSIPSNSTIFMKNDLFHIYIIFLVFFATLPLISKNYKVPTSLRIHTHFSFSQS